jgi:hypothetical protein
LSPLHLELRGNLDIIFLSLKNSARTGGRRAMSWNLIKAIQASDVDMRLVKPYGLRLRLGDIVKVDEKGGLTLEGSCFSILRERPLPSRKGSSGDLFVQSAKGTSIKFLAAGTASTQFPELPQANAGVKIEFEDSQSWMFACTGRVIEILEDHNRFRQAILSAYRRKVWDADWALVTQVATVESLTLIAATSDKTQVVLSLGASVADGATMEAKLTAHASIASTTSALDKWISNEPASAFINAIRVKPGWLRDSVVALEAVDDTKERDFLSAPDEEAWEDVDA